MIRSKDGLTFFYKNNKVFYYEEKALGVTGARHFAIQGQAVRKFYQGENISDNATLFICE